jgi:hypothetical protein
MAEKEDTSSTIIDWVQSEKHGEASKVFKMEKENDLEACPCNNCG